ncbi:MAG: amino acid ABC transporter permease, partial [Cohaesibacteraceae bacterium]|nr:amino acid ABC transporter permease [Cohaesibacteraceae bacterium]
MSDINHAYVLTEMADERPAPVATSGPILWLRTNLFSSVTNASLTIFALYLVYLVLPPL